MLLALSLSVLFLFSPADPAERGIGRPALMKHLRVLCAPSLEGRMALNPGADKAARYIAAAFAGAGLEPFGGKTAGGKTDAYIGKVKVCVDVMDKDIRLDKKSGGKNRTYVMTPGGASEEGCLLVLGRLPGKDRKLKDEIVLVVAHYDGQGRDGTGAVFPGADRNASGVAALIEAGRALVRRRGGVRRTVVFAALPAGEAGTFMRRPGKGTSFERFNKLVVRYLVESGEWDTFLNSRLVRMPGRAGVEAFIVDPPLPLDKVRAVVDLDMVGGTLPLKGAAAAGGPGEGEEGVQASPASPAGRMGIAVVGCETGEGLRKSLEKACADPELPVLFLSYGEAEKKGWKNATESFSFLRARLPSLWITTGPAPRHGTPEDSPEAVDQAGLEGAARLAFRIIKVLANEQKVHPFRKN